MKRTLFIAGKAVAFIVIVCMLTGCSVAFYRRWPEDKKRINELSTDLQRLERLKAQETKELQEAMALLEKRLKSELSDKNVKLEMAERGLVITFVAEVLFDSGKAKLKEDAYSSLKKVARVLKNQVADKNVAVEGHTDSEPIQYSAWKSNWELSTARATSVLHYLVNEAGVAPERLQATGYGEYRPVATNMTEEGRQENRRVEIIIIPRVSKKDLTDLEDKKRRLK